MNTKLTFKDVQPAINTICAVTITILYLAAFILLAVFALH